MSTMQMLLSFLGKNHSGFFSAVEAIEQNKTFQLEISENYYLMRNAFAKGLFPFEESETSRITSYPRILR